MRDPRLPILPDEPLLREPLEYPPPDPPLAFAKEMVGTPIRDNAMHAAMSLVVFKTGFLSIDVVVVQTRRGILAVMASRKPKIRPVVEVELVAWRLASL